MKRLPLLFTLLALIFLAVSATYWGMQLYKPPQRNIAPVQTAALPEPSSDAAATLFGGQPVTAVVSNYQLTGIVAAGRDSVAILVADGQPPKALKVGRELAPGVSVSEVHPKYIMLSEGGVMKRVDLVADTRPAIPLSGAAPMGVPQMGVPQMGQRSVVPGAMPSSEPQTAPGAVQPPPPGEVNPVIPQGQEPPQEGPPPDVAPPPPPTQPQMPPPTRVMGSPVSGAQPPTQ